MTHSVRFAIIGTGGIAQSYIAAFAENPIAQLVAVADTNPHAATAVAAKLGIPAWSSASELLSQHGDVQAVIVCTPPNTHEQLVLECVRAGKHVLCEKPFTLTSHSARTMVRAARAAGVQLTMGSKFRYATDVIKARELMQSGTIGDVVLFENCFAGRVDMSKRWNSVKAISGGGVLIDNGTHSVDILRYFLGPLAEVHALEGRSIQALEVEDTARIFVRSKSGIMGSVDLSWSLNKELEWYIQLFGSQGVIQVGWKRSRYKVGQGEWIEFGNGYDKVTAFRNQVMNFADAIQTGAPLVISWEDAIASVEVIEAAYESMRTAPWTDVADNMCTTHTPPPRRGLPDRGGQHV